MLLGINHRKDAMFGEIGQTPVPIALEILGAYLVDLFKGVEIRYADFIGREAHNGSVLLVEAVDVEASLTRYHGAF